MKVLFVFFIVTSLLIACTKTENNPLSTFAFNDVIARKDTMKVPINDLGTGTFMGYVGGLYPGGVNNPSGVYARDLQSACKLIIPIDTFGRTSASGRITFISLGGSTSGHLFDSLQAKTASNPNTNPSLQLIKCSNGFGSASLNSMLNPVDPYWDHVTQLLHGNRSSYKQVQVIYLETDDSTKYVNFPGRPDTVKQELQGCFRLFKIKFPSLKMIYLLGRTTTFNTGDGQQKVFNREPCPYYFGWACKWAIEDQINGVKGTQYKGKDAVSPMITWAWYEWADGTTKPRKDGFVWTVDDTKDGLHATPTGEDTLSTRFQNFLLTDPNASVWYTRHQ